MTKEILIYGLAKEATQDWQEDLLSTNCKTEQDIQKVLKVATEHGFHSFRITSYNGEAPNFIKALTI